MLGMSVKQRETLSRNLAEERENEVNGKTGTHGILQRGDRRVGARGLQGPWIPGLQAAWPDVAHSRFERIEHTHTSRAKVSTPVCIRSLFDEFD